MFVQSEKFVEEHQGRVENLSTYGQELNFTTWKLCKMNLAIRGLDANLGPHHDDTFHNDLHKTLKVDYILSNPPFNISDWGGARFTKEYIQMNTRGSNQQYIPLGVLKNLPVKYPNDIKVMKEIINILLTLDEKIEINNQINKN